jgi:hypothetical protein
MRGGECNIVGKMASGHDHQAPARPTSAALPNPKPAFALPEESLGCAPEIQHGA